MAVPLQFDARASFASKLICAIAVFFHAFDEAFGDLVDQANARLVDPGEGYYDMAYASRRAIDMRILQSRERSGRYIDHDNNVDSWKAIVALSSAASLAGRSNDETENSVVSTGRSSQDLEGFQGEKRWDCVRRHRFVTKS